MSFDLEKLKYLHKIVSDQEYCHTFTGLTSSPKTIFEMSKWYESKREELLDEVIEFLPAMFQIFEDIQAMPLMPVKELLQHLDKGQK